MTREQAKAIADVMGGYAGQTGGGNVYCVFFDCPEGEMIVISDDLICVYRDKDAWHAGEATTTIQYRF